MRTTTRPHKFFVSIIGAIIVSSTIVATPAGSHEIDVRQGAREAAVVLEELPVKGRAPKTGYSRSAFGSAWSDVNGNGCDTRNDVLARDLDERTMSGSLP